MNEIRPNLSSSTMGYVVVTGLLSVAMLNALPEDSIFGSKNHALSNNAYSANDRGATSDSFRSKVTGQYDLSPPPFEQVVVNFYANLLAIQEPLGAAFEKVLYDNLWDLYES
jgi:hypothetical protein